MSSTVLFADSGDVTGSGNTGVRHFPFGHAARFRGRLVADGLAGGDTLKMVLSIRWTGLDDDASGGNLIITEIFTTGSDPMFHDFVLGVQSGGRAAYYQFYWSNVSGTVRAKAYGVFAQA